MHPMRRHTQIAMQEKNLNKEKENMKMKKNYETPEILLAKLEKTDVITTSGGDVPRLSVFGW